MDRSGNGKIPGPAVASGPTGLALSRSHRRHPACRSPGALPWSFSRHCLATDSNRLQSALPQMLGKTLVRCYKIDENADVPVPDLGQTGYNERAIGINMRLTCPNCSARYEVADSMVPPEGRDVQCSNCSTTWFQPGRRTDVEPAIAPKRGDATPPPEPAPPAGDAEAEPEQPADTPPGIENVIEAAAGAAAGTGPRRQEMEPGIRDILREEAERETRLRQAEAGSVETQSEMPLDEG